MQEVRELAGFLEVASDNVEGTGSEIDYGCAGYSDIGLDAGAISWDLFY
jgi:hypothetical protein